MDTPREIMWREPRGAQAREFLDEVRRLGWVRPVFWVRLLMITFAASGMVFAATCLSAPPLDVPIRLFLIGPVVSITGFAACMLWAPLVLLLCHRTIEVCEDAIVESGYEHNLSGLVEATIEPRGITRPILVLRRMLRNGRNYKRTFELAPSVDVAELQGILDRINERWRGTEPRPPFNPKRRRRSFTSSR